MKRHVPTTIFQEDSLLKTTVFDSCTVCLNDFTHGETLKSVPGCGHSFHGSCLDKWLERRFVCPNCNLDISKHVVYDDDPNWVPGRL